MTFFEAVAWSLALGGSIFLAGATLRAVLS